MVSVSSQLYKYLFLSDIESIFEVHTFLGGGGVLEEKKKKGPF